MTTQVDQTLSIHGLEQDELTELRLRKMRRQFRYCYDNSDFYRERFDAAGAQPEDIKTWQDFRRLPVFLTKEIHRQSQERSLQRDGHPYGTFLTAPLEEVTGVYGTSGTTGTPTFFTFAERDFEIHHELAARIVWQAGVRPGDTVMWAQGALGIWIGAPYFSMFRQRKIRSINVGAESGTERILQYLTLTRPSTLFATPSLAEYLIERCSALLGRPVGELGIQTLMLGGEPGAGLPEMARKLREAYGARLYDFVGPSHWWAYVSCDAPEYAGMHDLAADYGVSCDDLVDPITKEPVEIVDGAIGEMLFTDLERVAGPVIKYAYGDVVQVFTEPCVCGSRRHRIKFLGRADDMLIVMGANVYPSAVKNLVDSFAPRTTGAMRIVLSHPGPRVEPPLRLRVEHGEGLSGEEIEKLRQDIVERMRAWMRVRPQVEIVPPRTIERFEKKTRLISIEPTQAI